MKTANILLIAAIFVFMVPGILLANAGDSPGILIVGVDISDDSVLVRNQTRWAKKAGEWVAAEVEKQPLMSRLVGVTFGDGSPVSNQTIVPEVQLTVRKRPKTFAHKLARFIQDVPRRVQEGELVAQDESRILEFLKDQASLYGCQGTHALVITEGLQFAKGGANAYASLRAGGRPPLQPSQELKGCVVTILGLGLGYQPDVADGLEKLWRVWAEASGVQLRLIRTIN